jgi:hypothetical protein
MFNQLESDLPTLKLAVLLTCCVNDFAYGAPAVTPPPPARMVGVADNDSDTANRTG